MQSKPRRPENAYVHDVCPHPLAAESKSAASPRLVNPASAWEQVQNYEFYVKQENIFGIICKNRKLCVSLQRQDGCLGYPVSFRVGARLDRHYSNFIKESL